MPVRAPLRRDKRLKRKRDIDEKENRVVLPRGRPRIELLIVDDNVDNLIEANNFEEDQIEEDSDEEICDDDDTLVEIDNDDDNDGEFLFPDNNNID